MSPAAEATLPLFDPDLLGAVDPAPHVPDPAPPAIVELTPAQQAAVDAREHSVALSASAGSGKTAVLVERFVRAVVDDEVDPARILAITFTEKAAGELRDRVRAGLAGRGRFAEAGRMEGAFVSTIHGFCARLLRAHPLTAGLDPGFEVLDEPRAARLRDEASAAALRRVLAEGGEEALDVVAAYTPDRIGRLVRAAYDELRSRGHDVPRLPDAPTRLPPDAERVALRAAHARFAAELGEAGEGSRIDTARDALARCGEVLDELEPGDVVPWPGRLAATLVRPGNVAALKTDAATAYIDARAAFEKACADHHAATAVAVIDALLRAYGAAYTRAKAARGAVDFDDLELRARDLLRDHAAIRTAWRARFVLLMVDEFQDTNRRQLEVLEALGDDNLFTVGDAQQSIYAFRHADVSIFSARRAALRRRGLSLELAESFRSAPALLHALNVAFAAELGDDHVTLRPGGNVPDAADGSPAVELLVTAGDWSEDEQRAAALADGLPPGPPARHAEARLVAQRLRELVEAGTPPGEIAVLVRASGSMPVLERALEAEGLPTLATAGRGFWSRQEVVDLVASLAVLANPRDERALLSALASPLCGADADTLALLVSGARAQGRDLWWHLRETLVDDAVHVEPRAHPVPAVEQDEPWAPRVPAAPEPLDALDPAQRDRLAAFAAHVAAERAHPGRHGLDALLERAMERAGYDLHLLGLHGGERRLANVGKLLRLARDFEAAEGRNLRGLVDHAVDLEAAGRREPEAPVEDPDRAAISLMTIHAAKGLEFGTVVVADLGRRPNTGQPDLLVGEDGRLGLRLALLDGGDTTEALDYTALKEARREADAREERRVLYVALTRAEHRLILSATVEGWRESTSSPPITWLGRALVPDLPERVEEASAHEIVEHEGARIALTVSTPATYGQALRANQGSDLHIGPTYAKPGSDEAAAHDPAFAHVGPMCRSDPPFALGRYGAALSYSSLTEWAKCGLRFHARRVLRLPERPAPPGVSALAPPTGLDPRVRGVIVHALVEELDFASPAPPDPARVAALAAAEGVTTPLPDAQLDDVTRLVAAFAEHPLRARLAAAPRVRREHEFAFELRAGDDTSPLLTGILDVLAVDTGGTWLVVDHKTDRLEPDADPEALVARDYALQRALYALACLRAGAQHVEVAHLYLEAASDGLATAHFTPADEPALTALLARAADPVARGEHPLTDRPHAGLCATCPARGALCPYPPELTLRAAPPAEA